MEVVAYLSMISLVSIVLTVSPIAVWGYIVMFCLLCSQRLGSTFDKGMTKWFTVAKFAGALVGVVALTYVRHVESEQPPGTALVTMLLAINIFEALARDVREGNWTNALSALVLVATLPPNAHATVKGGSYTYALSPVWIALYSSWNAVFSYANNFAWTTRLILLPPLAAVVIQGPSYWLGLRATSLLVHLTMRAIHFTKFYVPGASSLTPCVDTVTHDKAMSKLWGAANFMAALVYFFFHHSTGITGIDIRHPTAQLPVLNA